MLLGLQTLVALHLVNGDAALLQAQVLVQDLVQVLGQVLAQVLAPLLVVLLYTAVQHLETRVLVMPGAGVKRHCSQT